MKNITGLQFPPSRLHASVSDDFICWEYDFMTSSRITMPRINNEQKSDGEDGPQRLGSISRLQDCIEKNHSLCWVVPIPAAWRAAVFSFFLLLLNCGWDISSRRKNSSIWLGKEVPRSLSLCSSPCVSLCHFTIPNWNVHCMPNEGNDQLSGNEHY